MKLFCPYFGRAVEATFTKEHVIPHALGCPDSFALKVSSEANGSVNQTFESAFLALPIISYYRNIFNISSYNARSVPGIAGTILEGDAQVVVRVDQSGNVVGHVRNVSRRDDSPQSRPNAAETETVIESGTEIGTPEQLSTIDEGRIKFAGASSGLFTG